MWLDVVSCRRPTPVDARLGNPGEGVRCHADAERRRFRAPAGGRGGCGALIGLERQWRARLAGLRTNALVAGGATLFVLYAVATEDSSPTRVVSYVVSGIGFLGGGVILREGFTVRGLNTAATLWCAAAVGCLAGWGFLPQAPIAAVSIIAANLVLRPLAMKFNRQPLQNTEVETHYTCSVVCRGEDEAHVRTLLLYGVNNAAMTLQALDSEDQDGSNKVQVQANLIMAD